MISSKFHTKNWRKNQIWYKTGKSNECEKFQLSQLDSLKLKIVKCSDRIDSETYTIVSIANPHKKEDGYKYTENFDGKCVLDEQTIYFNLKFVCDKGGAQTRSLKLTYDFIKLQYSVLLTNKFIFVNILDGDESFKNMDKFNYLAKLHKGADGIFVGDMAEFMIWWIEKKECMANPLEDFKQLSLE